MPNRGGELICRTAQTPAELERVAVLFPSLALSAGSREGFVLLALALRPVERVVAAAVVEGLAEEETNFLWEMVPARLEAGEGPAFLSALSEP